MLKNIAFKFVVVLLFSAIVAGNSNAADFKGGLMTGYSNGLSFEFRGNISQFAQGFPFQIEFGIGYTSLDPGNAADARRIFINDATNGDPEKSGRIWDFRLDFLYPVNWLGANNTYIYAGPRLGLFNGNFKFIGGNEDFDITSDQWALGTGLKAFFPMGQRFNLVVSTGVDFYFYDALSGHDTSYSSDGENINARNDYKFEDANEAINQPRLRLNIMMGIAYRF
jgi:hypothetical protein